MDLSMMVRATAGFSSQKVLSFSDTIPASTHEEGFKMALTKVINDYGHRMNILKEGEKLSGDDVREGLTAVISVKLTDAQFEGQTKAKLGNSGCRPRSTWSLPAPCRGAGPRC